MREKMIERILESLGGKRQEKQRKLKKAMK